MSKRVRPWLRRALPISTLTLVTVLVVFASDQVPTDIEQPGTQPGEVTSFATNCDNCHSGTDNPAVEPSFGWHGSMMSHSMRDGLFWATVAIAEQDFLPNADPALRGGVGDLCLRCHGPAGWLGGRSTPTDGSSFSGNDERGVECEFCHLMVDPDAPTNIAGTVEEQTAPYEAFDDEGHGYYGSGQYVINSEGTRLGPFDDAVANHAFYGSDFHRKGEFCGTCHDVSNPAVGDLAPNHGSMVPLDEGTYSGTPGTPVTTKAAFNNAPYRYGIVERTFSEWKASALGDWPLETYGDLPSDLRVPGGALDVAYQRAIAGTGDPDYADGTTRTFTCQTCHLSAAVGKGCTRGSAPTRPDLPRHDMTGGGYWMPDVVEYQFDRGTLRFGELTDDQRTALAAGKLRSEAMLESAASLTLGQTGSALTVRVMNLTGHKLISGYPEGRRMWLNVKWRDAGGGLISEEGAYGPIGRQVQDLDGAMFAVESLLSPNDAVVFEAKPGMDQAWAVKLLSLGYDATLPLTYDRLTDAIELTLGDLAAEEVDHRDPTFHFVLNNVIVKDNRIPPFGFRYDDALTRGALPVPASQYGGPQPGQVYDHWADEAFDIPTGAVTADVTLYYQQTSWEYIQFLWLANDGLSSFLGQEGENMLDAWLHTGMSAPFPMASATLELGPPAGVPGEASPPVEAEYLLSASWMRATGTVQIDYEPACDAQDHTLYYGSLATLAMAAYEGAVCDLGTSGAADVTLPAGDLFFLVVANDGQYEGSYGRASDGTERPEASSGTLPCGYVQDLTSVVCE